MLEIYLSGVHGILDRSLIMSNGNNQSAQPTQPQGINPQLLDLMAVLSGAQQGPVGDMGKMAHQWVQNQSYVNMMKNMLSQNQAIQNMSLADTAGLTPEHMSNIMKTMLEQRAVNQRGLSNAYEALYKAGLLKSYERQSGDRNRQLLMNQLNIQRERDERVPVNIGGQIINLSQKDYANYMKDPVQYRLYMRTLDLNESPSSEGFERFLKQYTALGGGLNLEDTVAKTKAVGKAKQEVELSDPRYLTTMAGKLNKNIALKYETLAPYKYKIGLKGYEGADLDRMAERHYIAETYNRQLKNAFGKESVEVDIDKATNEYVWKVNGEEFMRY